MQNKSKPKATAKTVKANKKNYTFLIILALVMLLITVLRLRLLSIPLERDEGEYAYIGQLILQGIPPYEIAYNMKFPGTYYMYAFFMSIFGQTIKGVHAGLLIMNLTSIFLIFFLVKKLINEYAALVSATAFAFLSLGMNILGFAGHATHFVIVPALAGTLFLYKALKENKMIHYFLSGIFLSLAPIMKQQGILFCVFGALIMLINFYIQRKDAILINVKRFLIFALGGIIPVVLTFIVLKMYGVFDKFWFWTIVYAQSYETAVKFNDAMILFNYSFFPLAGDFYFIWIISGLGLITMFFHPLLKKNFKLTFIILFLIFSCLSVCPGFYYRQHYFITVLPAISILFGIFISYLYELSLKDKKYNALKIVSFILFVLPFIVGISSQKNYLFKMKPNAICDSIYGSNPFTQSLTIAKYIKANSDDSDKVAVLGSEPQICFYANRHSATGYIYTYGLMEVHENSLKMQKEMINEIEKAKPKFFVVVNVPTSWLVQPGSEKFIFNWIDPYLQKNKYMIAGIADIYSNATVYKWNEEAYSYKPGSESYILIFKKSEENKTK
ncbi:MAG TPA: glycosyltransferase family 39 protein [Bacteroidales bacterium]|nr:glycosyltransferase family 39 protein [Bacteroidales bacterium]HPS17702.1 glycosyltransferase family 39 protein [Bacteroidales bacterium]